MADHQLVSVSRGATTRLATLIGILFLIAAEAPRLWKVYTGVGDPAANPAEVEIGLLVIAALCIGIAAVRAARERMIVTSDGLSLRKGSRRFEVPWSNIREIGNVVIPRGKEDWMSWKEAELRIRLHEKIGESDGPGHWTWTSIWVENGEYVIFPQSRFKVLDLAGAFRAIAKSLPAGITIRDRLRWRDRKDEEILRDAMEW